MSFVSVCGEYFWKFSENLNASMGVDDCTQFNNLIVVDRWNDLCFASEREKNKLKCAAKLKR